MLVAAFEIKTVSFFQPVLFTAIEHNFEGAAQNIKKFLAVVCVGFSAAGRRSDAKQVRLHHCGITPG